MKQLFSNSMTKNFFLSFLLRGDGMFGRRRE
ncbi:hypothetical protein Mgra_00000405 [Meloidogyne graminicola]|uniref:Uncharacterized protein n=1 Tax=Meloidogyne graminicola TaxID=189291 RepID=A0A8T0A319_9BILA|nr:hypothetical protein Mgra_00000405 [Meloidogyne graminicola]